MWGVYMLDFDELYVLCEYKLLEYVLNRKATNSDLSFYKYNVKDGIIEEKTKNGIVLKCENYAIKMGKDKSVVLYKKDNKNNYVKVKEFEDKIQLY